MNNIKSFRRKRICSINSAQSLRNQPLETILALKMKENSHENNISKNRNRFTERY